MEEAHWSSLAQRGRIPRSEEGRWKQESCTRSWSRCDELHADVSCIPAGKPEERARLILNQQRAVFGRTQCSVIQCNSPEQ